MSDDNLMEISVTPNKTLQKPGCSSMTSIQAKILFFEKKVYQHTYIYNHIYTIFVRHSIPYIFFHSLPLLFYLSLHTNKQTYTMFYHNLFFYPICAFEINEESVCISLSSLCITALETMVSDKVVSGRVMHKRPVILK